MSPAEHIEPEIEEIKVQIGDRADVDLTVESAPEIGITLAPEEFKVVIDPREIQLNVDRSPEIRLTVDSSPDILVLPTTGAIGPPGPPGPPGPGATYIHDQLIPNYLWQIVHNLNLFPSVTVVDSGGTEIIPDVHYISQNEINLSFENATSGKAYLN